MTRYHIFYIRSFFCGGDFGRSYSVPLGEWPSGKGKKRKDRQQKVDLKSNAKLVRLCLFNYLAPQARMKKSLIHRGVWRRFSRVRRWLPNWPSFSLKIQNRSAKVDNCFYKVIISPSFDFFNVDKIEKQSSILCFDRSSNVPPPSRTRSAPSQQCPKKKLRMLVGHRVLGKLDDFFVHRRFRKERRSNGWYISTSGGWIRIT